MNYLRFRRDMPSLRFQPPRERGACQIDYEPCWQLVTLRLDETSGDDWGHCVGREGEGGEFLFSGNGQLRELLLDLKPIDNTRRVGPNDAASLISELCQRSACATVELRQAPSVQPAMVAHEVLISTDMRLLIVSYCGAGVFDDKVPSELGIVCLHDGVFVGTAGDGRLAFVAVEKFSQRQLINGVVYDDVSASVALDRLHAIYYDLPAPSVLRARAFSLRNEFDNMLLKNNGFMRAWDTVLAAHVNSLEYREARGS